MASESDAMGPAAASATIIPDWDTPGTLTILVQGALFQGNMIETANNCAHWRAVFPRAEIVLVLSVTDILVGTVVDGIIDAPRLIPRLRHDGYMQASLATILRSCDTLALAEPALPLPPIKRDADKPNNTNLLIAAARRGLDLATGRFVLRIRSDMVFGDRSFIDQWLAAESLPRGAAAVLRQRVLISWLYTLNPFAGERMPLHFSDWFHFGLLEDVRLLWDVPPLTLSDSVYYRTHPHDPSSNRQERLFNIRLGVEQHLLYHSFKRHFPALLLDRHNDLRSVDLSLSILVDNFVTCDLVRAHCLFDKYAREFVDGSKRFQCIPAESWLALAQTDDPAKRRAVLTEGDEDTAEPAVGFRRVFPANRLKTTDGSLIDGELVSATAKGVLFYGPYITLKRGLYAATVHVTRMQGAGTLTLTVTQDSGGHLLARRKLAVDGTGPQDIVIPFEVPSATAAELEVVCNFQGMRLIAASGVTIAARPRPFLHALTGRLKVRLRRR